MAAEENNSIGKDSFGSTNFKLVSISNFNDAYTITNKHFGSQLAAKGSPLFYILS